MARPEDKLLETWKDVYSPCLNASTPPYVLKGVLSVAQLLLNSPYKNKLLADRQFSEDMEKLTNLAAKAILAADDVEEQLRITKRLVALQRYLVNYESLKRFEIRQPTRESLRKRIQQFPELSALLDSDPDLGVGQNKDRSTRRSRNRLRDLSDYDPD
jgi:hypothetical protein